MNTRSMKIRLTTGALVVLVGVMVGLSFASVPLYRLFCQVTGYDGTPKTVGVVRPTEVAETTVTVRFDANVNSALPWSFQPMQRQLQVRLGEEILAHYTARNLSDHPITGTATFNVVPEKAARYFSKIECFCFTEQTLAAGEEVSMPVLFFVDPELARDPTVNEVSNIVLSYTFYRAEGEGSPQGKAAEVATGRNTGAGG